jgi:hypothetical protein
MFMFIITRHIFTHFTITIINYLINYFLYLLYLTLYIYYFNLLSFERDYNKIKDSFVHNKL